jgi:glc operon protein GlcG
MNLQPIETRKFLTHKAVLAMLAAAMDRAEAIGQPQCIIIVDASGGTLGELKMTGAKFLSPEKRAGQGPDGGIDR